MAGEERQEMGFGKRMQRGFVEHVVFYDTRCGTSAVTIDPRGHEERHPEVALRRVWR